MNMLEALATVKTMIQDRKEHVNWINDTENRFQSTKAFQREIDALELLLELCERSEEINV